MNKRIRFLSPTIILGLVSLLVSCGTSVADLVPGHPVPERSFSIMAFNSLGGQVQGWSQPAPSTIFIEPVLNIAPEDVAYEGRLVSNLPVDFGEGNGWEYLDADFLVLNNGVYVPSSDNTDKIRHKYTVQGTYTLKILFYMWDGSSYEDEVEIIVLPARDAEE